MPRAVPSTTCVKSLMLLTRLLAFGLFSTFASMAQAQTFDWVVNINDAGFDPVSAGADVEYVVEVDNNNNVLTIPPTSVTLDVPANTVLTSITGDFTSCMEGGAALVTPINTGAGGLTVTCDVPQLGPLGSASSVVDLRTLQLGVIELTASVPTTDDLDIENNIRTEETTVRAGSDLQIALAAPAAAGTGDLIDFDISVQNNGPNIADSFQIEFPIPMGVSNLTGANGGALPAGCSVSGGVVTCSVSGPLNVANPPGSIPLITLSFEGRVTAAGGSTITGSASVLNATPNDPISTNNTATTNTTVNDGTDVSVSISRPGTTALITGQTVRFTLESTYSGNAPTDAVIETTIPANYTIDNVSSPDGWVCDPITAARLLRCELPADPTGQGIDVSMGSIFIDTTVASTGTPTISTEISVGAAPPETNFGNNTDTLSETITDPVVDLRANKDGPDPRVGVVGETIDYRISTTNSGTADFIGAVRMVDTLPPGLTVSNVAENGWTCTTGTNGSGDATVTCDLTYSAAAPLEPGDRTNTVTISALVTATATGNLVNTMTVSTPGANDEVTLSNNTTTYEITAQAVAASADLDINQFVSQASLAIGDIQTVYIEVANIGPNNDTSFDVRVNETFRNLINGAVGPTGAGFIDAVPFAQGVATGVSCDPPTPSGGSGRALVCNIAEVPRCTPSTQATPGAAPSGGTCPIIAVRIRPGGPLGERSHRAAVTSLTTPDPDLANRRATIRYQVVGDIDVTVSKNVTPDPAVAGQNVTYVVTASNLAADPGAVASAVTITDDLPDNVRFVSATPTAGSCGTQPSTAMPTSNSQLICNLGDINGGEQQTVTVIVRPTTVTRLQPNITNTVSVSSVSEPASNLGNNSASAVVAVAPPRFDVLVNKDDSADPVLVGENTIYTLTVTNAGPSAAEDVVITDVLPASIFAYRSHTISGGGTCSTIPLAADNTPGPAANAALRTIQCTFPYLPVNQSEVINITMEAVAQGTVRNDVSISSAEILAGFDTEAGNNQTSETTTARQTADIAVTRKTPSAATLNLREGFDYVIRVANNPDVAGFDAANVVLIDTLPTGMVLTGPPVAVNTAAVGTISQNTCTGVANDTSFQCNFGTVSPTAEVLITVPVKVVSITAAGQMLTNTALVSTSSFDSNTGNNSATGTVTVNGSSLAGTVYRDLDNSATSAANGQNDPGDTGISGITMTLTGRAVDGELIMETAVTNGNGDYIFPFLPAAQTTYTLTRGTVSLAGFVTGQNTIGSQGGTVPSGTVTQDIPLPINTAATDYDFAETPGTQTAAIALIKTASTAGFANPPQAGDLVTYSFRIRNTGDVTLTNVTLTDAVPGVMLTGTPIPSLAPGEENTTAYTATYALLDTDLGGQVSNTATVTGTPPVGGNVSDVSGTSLTNDTPTTTDVPLTPPFVAAPAIALNKTLDDSATDDGAQVGDVLSYGFVITNTGNVPLFDVTVTDPLPGLALFGAPIPQLAPGESDAVTYTATYRLTQADLNVGNVLNTARVDGTYPQGSGQTVSDTDTETATFEAAPAQTIEAIPETFPPFTDGGTTTTMLASDLLNGEPVSLDTVTLTVLREDEGVTLDPVTALITLAPGLPAGTYEVDYRICAIATPDLCDETTEVVVQAANPGVETTKMQEFVDNGDTVEGEGDTIIYEITVENSGNITLENVTVLDTLQDGQGFGLLLSTGPDFVSATAGSPEGTLAPGEMATYSATFLVNAQAVTAGGVSNTVDAGGIPVTIPGVPGSTDPVRDISDDGDDSDGNTQNDPTVFTLVAPPVSGAVIDNLTLTKTTTSDVVRRGDAVPYTIAVQNNSNIATGTFTVEDMLPTGFVYVPGSASITPSAVAAGKITWTGIQLPPLSSIEITLSARILSTVRAGDHINRANVRNPATGQQLVDEETATVRIVPEAVFDCGEVIGKVFTDLNGDGYQNGAPGRESGVTDQTYAGGKGGKGVTAPLPQTEKGIPNVRLVTVDGSIITTDEHGRYSVPCAALPADRGSNFILKLDTRSLPSGYRVTTENPRVVRLTPGMMSELNFGATIGKVVRVDLDASAFGMTDAGKVALSAPLKAGIAQLLPQIAGEAVNLRLTFHVPQNADAAYVKTARQMLRAADKHIKREWRKVGRTRLLVEHAIARVGQ